MATVFQLAPYRREDEQSWLRCRVLAFLDTTYYDDVVTSKLHDDAAVQLVVKRADSVVALLDASVDGDHATLECIAVHPDFQRQGHGRWLLAETVRHLRAVGVRSIGAWTREDPPALEWYAAQGFRETARYLHVYADAYTGDLDDALAVGIRSHTALEPMRVFAHAPIEREEELRNKYHRVYVCRCFEKELT